MEGGDDELDGEGAEEEAHEPGEDGDSGGAKDFDEGRGAEKDEVGAQGTGEAGSGNESVADEEVGLGFGLVAEENHG